MSQLRIVYQKEISLPKRRCPRLSAAWQTRTRQRSERICKLNDAPRTKPRLCVKTMLGDRDLSFHVNRVSEWQAMICENCANVVRINATDHRVRSCKSMQRLPPFLRRRVLRDVGTENKCGEVAQIVREQYVDPIKRGNRSCRFFHLITGRSPNGRFLRHRPKRSERRLNYG